MDRFRQVGKSLHKDSQESSQNTRRIQANLPLVERKLDILSGDVSYKMETPLTGFSHSVRMSLRVKPDNCCDCDPGARADGRDVITFPTAFGPLVSGISDGIDYPAIYGDLQQTGTNFNYGYSSPFFHPIYQTTTVYGGYDHGVGGGITVPTDGIYSILFRNLAGGTAIEGSEIVMSIKQLHAVDPNAPPGTPAPTWNTISRRIYSAEKNNICWTRDFKPATGPWPSVCGLGQFSPIDALIWGGLYMYLYAACVPLNKGDTVGGWLQATNVLDWTPGLGDLSDNHQANMTSINLVGLGYGILKGRVKDTSGNPIANATVTFNLAGGGTTTTDEFGNYVFYDMTPSLGYTVTVSAGGYTTLSRDVDVIFNKVANLDFELS